MKHHATLQKTEIRTDTPDMRGLLRGLLHDEDGIGIASALAVSIVIFILGATWYSVSVHELEEVGYDRHLSTAVNVAEAGAREAMYRLASNDGGFRDAADGGLATSGVSGTTCVLSTLETVVDGTSELQGEYWVRATPLPPDFSYLIESWGWAPSHTGQQAVLKKVSIEVELVPQGGGFYHALFASEGGLVAGNRKEIYGDAYSGGNLEIGNFTRVFPNDDGAPGTGQVYVYRDLIISGGSNADIAGETKVNGFINDQAGSNFGIAGHDVVILNDTSLSALTKSTFKKNQSNVGRNLMVAGPAASVTDPPSASGYVWNATGIPPVPPIGLPTFQWQPAKYSGVMPVEIHTTWADFQAWYDGNDTALTGAHFVQEPAAYTLDMSGAVFDTDFVLAFKGDLELRGTPSGVLDPSVAPVSVIIAGVQPDSDIKLSNNANSVEGQVHHLIYAGGTFSAAQQTTIYGAMYGREDASTNRLEIHFRPPSENATVGFVFDPSLADEFLARPGIWREVPPDTLGCTLP
jgi:hypothetical protein